MGGVSESKSKNIVLLSVIFGGSYRIVIRSCIGRPSKIAFAGGDYETLDCLSRVETTKEPRYWSDVMRNSI